MAGAGIDILWSRTTERLTAGNTTSSDRNATIAGTAVGLNITWNVSVPEGCIPFRFDLMEYLPWDNPDNIVSVEFQDMTRRLKDLLLPFFFLIGGPANVINMLVFYKQGLNERVNLCLFALSMADLIYLTQLLIIFGEQLKLQFTTREMYGPFLRFMINNNLTGLYGISWVSQILSAIIATERCLCVLKPLRFQTLLRTRTMAAIIIVVYVVTLGLCFVVVMRYRIACLFDLLSGTIMYAGVTGDFYGKYEKFVNYLDIFVYGAGIPAVVVIVVTATTIITSLKIRQAAAWRAGSSSASGKSSSSVSQELALTKMLIGIAVLFIVFVFPLALFRFVCLFMPEMNVGRRNQNFYMSGVWILDMSMSVNSSFNFFVYYTIGSRYRETFWALFGRKKKGKAMQRIGTEQTATVGPRNIRNRNPYELA